MKCHCLNIFIFYHLLTYWIFKVRPRDWHFIKNIDGVGVGWLVILEHFVQNPSLIAVVVQSLGHISMDCSTPGFPVLHSLMEFAQVCIHWIGDTTQPWRFKYNLVLESVFLIASLKYNSHTYNLSIQSVQFNSITTFTDLCYNHSSFRILLCKEIQFPLAIISQSCNLSQS